MAARVFPRLKSHLSCPLSQGKVEGSSEEPNAAVALMALAYPHGATVRGSHGLAIIAITATRSHHQRVRNDHDYARHKTKGYVFFGPGTSMG